MSKKVMNQIGSYVIAILDDNNYVVYDVRRDSVSKKTGKVTHAYSFHTLMEQAEERLSRDYADETTSSTNSWHKCREETLWALRCPADDHSLTNGEEK